MPVNIYLANARSRSVISQVRANIVIEDRNNDSSISSLVDHILEIFAIREFLAAAASTVFIFRLIQNNWTSFCDLVLCNEAGNVGDVTALNLLACAI